MPADASPMPSLPLGTSLVPGGLEMTFGIPFVAIIISAFLTGILTLQMFKYFTAYSHDPLAMKIAVAVVYVLDLAQFASIVDFTWWYLVRNWGNLTSVTIVRISYGLAVVFSTPVILIVQLVYIYRIYRLNPRLQVIWAPIAILVCLVLLESAFGFRGAAFGLHPILFTEANHDSGSQAYVVGVWLGTGVAADVGIASALVYNLVTRRTGFKRTDTLINKLVIYAINTCAFTSLIAVADIICFYSMPANNVHLGLNMLLCKLFSNSLLASLNRRTERRGHGRSDTNGSSTLSTFGVAVHKTRDTYTDSQTLGLSAAERSRTSNKDPIIDDDDNMDLETFTAAKRPSDEV